MVKGENIQIVAVTGSESKLKVVVVVAFEVAVLQVADKEFLDGDGCPDLGGAGRINHLALNLAVLVDEIHAEVVGHSLAH